MSVSRDRAAGADKAASAARPPDPSRRSQRAHRAILDAARVLLAARGYSGVTIEAIAAEAGVGKQTIYRWWPSKAAVIADMLVEGRMRSAPDFLQTSDFRSDLATVLRNTIASLRDPVEGRMLRVAFSAAQSDADLHDAFSTAIFVPVRAAYRARVLAAVAAGDIRAGTDPNALLDMAFGPIWFRALTRPDVLRPRFAEVVSDAIMAAFAP